MNTFLYPWRIEGRQTPFHPFKPVLSARTIEEAVSIQAGLKKAGGYYALRIRAA